MCRHAVTSADALIVDDPSELSNQITAPGILKIFGNEICEGAHYKSVLATTQSSAKELVKEALERWDHVLSVHVCVRLPATCVLVCELCVRLHAAVHLCVLHHLYIKAVRTFFDAQKSKKHVHVVVITVSHMNKVDLTRCSVCYNCSTVHTVYVCVCMSVSQNVHLVVLKRSWANHRSVWKTARVGHGSEAASQEGERLSGLA